MPSARWRVYNFTTGVACLALIGAIALVNRAAYAFGLAKCKWLM